MTRAKRCALDTSIVLPSVMSGIWPRAIIFDLDGTVVDTLEDVASAMNAALAEVGFPALSHDEVRACLGLGGTALARTALTKAGHRLDEVAIAALQKRYLRIYRNAPAKCARLYPHALTTLETLRASGVALALCTNKAEEITHPLLLSLAIAPFFSGIVCGDSFPRGKPDPLPVCALLKRLGVSQAAALLVGDTASDAQAARAAGIPFILASYGYGRLEPNAGDAMITGLDELEAALSRLRITRPNVGPRPLLLNQS